MKSTVVRRAFIVVLAAFLSFSQIPFLRPAHAAVSMSTLSNLDKEEMIARVLDSMPIRNEYLIVKPQSQLKSSEMEALLASNGASIQKVYKSGARLIKVPGSDRQALNTLKELLQNSGVAEYAEYDYMVHTMGQPCNDLLFFKQWGLKNTGQFIQFIPGKAGIDVNVVPAWNITMGNPQVVVAVLDTGIFLQHPELVDQAWVNPGEIPGNGIDDDNNGYIDDVNGWDFYNDDASVYDPSDQDIHGTHVAGVIAARNNNIQGISGIAPGVKIMALKFIGPNGGSVSDAIEAVEYARSMGVKISNNSWGGTEYSQALRDAIEQSGLLFVASAGNSGANADSAPEYPAAFDCTNIISVAAINNRGQMPSWSNYGPSTVDLAAPGVGILSILELIPGSTILYGYISGTSQAAPFVTGAGALVLSRNPGLSAHDVKSRILAGTRPLPALAGKTQSGGMLDAYGALNR
ncbi:MAG: S8 family peptidase [Syntrophomonas sp.]